jgi:hypothetical protein
MLPLTVVGTVQASSRVVLGRAADPIHDGTHPLSKTMELLTYRDRVLSK